VSKPIDPRLPDDDALVDRLLSGTASSEEIARLTPDERAAIDAYRAALDAHHGLADVWRRIEASEGRPQPARPPLTLVRTPSSTKAHGSPSRPISAPRHAWRRIAAGVAAVAIISAGVVQWMRLHTESRPVMPVALIAPRGQRLTTRLPDGTTLVLAPDSRLTYDAARFASADRAVSLVGQARFTVVRHDDHPFTVRAGQWITRDVGTTFSVRAYADAPVRVAVAEGSVAVARDASQRASSGLVLTAGMAAVADPSTPGDTLVAGSADSLSDFAWTTGTLTFHNTPLRDVAAAISRTSPDVDLTIQDATLANLAVTVAFHSETPDQACAMLALLAHATCHHTGYHVVLSRH
jgi:transmembrane sensor